MRDEQTVALNRRARHDFTIDETFEAGIVLTGTEIKSLRAGKVQLSDAQPTEVRFARGDDTPFLPPARPPRHHDHGVGPHVILELERRAPPDSPRDTIARLSLWAMADSRMADSLLTLARDPRQPMRDRILYLRLLTHYADCRTALDVRDHGPDDSVLWMAFDACGIGNKQSYSDADRARIRAGFAWIGEHDGDANLANLARLAAAELNLWATLEDSVRRASERTPRH